MRIIVNGQQAFGKAALETILKAGKDEVVAVYTAPDKEGRPVDPLKQAALDNEIPLHQPASYKDEAVGAEMKALKPDLMVMAYMIIFVPASVRSIPRHGSICFHPSLLPKHRGPSSINWPIASGATRTGLTWFWPNDGLDEGDILLQREVAIGPDETLGDIYFKKIFPLGLETTLDAIELIRAGNPPHIKQDDSKATYESWFRKDNARIDWEKDAAAVYNVIRAANPQPGAWTVLNGGEVQIFDARRRDGTGEPGTVVGVSEEGVLVQAKGGRVLVQRVRAKGGEKIPAAQWAKEAGVKVGTRLGE
jgi:methionyl-tRNA formyltransferase